MVFSRALLVVRPHECQGVQGVSVALNIRRGRGNNHTSGCGFRSIGDNFQIFRGSSMRASVAGLFLRAHLEPIFDQGDAGLCKGLFDFGVTSRNDGRAPSNRIP